MKTIMLFLGSLWATLFVFGLGSPNTDTEWVAYAMLLVLLWLWLPVTIMRPYIGRYHVNVWRKRTPLVWHYLTRDVYDQPVFAVVRLSVSWRGARFRASVWDASGDVPALLDFDEFRSLSHAQRYAVACLDVATDWYEEEVEE